MKIETKNQARAFTRFEGLVVCAVMLLLLAVFFPLPNRNSRKVAKINCVNNLKQDGVAFRIWEGDNGDRLPMNVPVSLGGVQELIATGNVVACFQVMSHELATPKIVCCPQDRKHNFATDFGAGFTRANVNYFIGLGATNDQPDTLLSGDANLVQNRKPAPPGFLNLWTNNTSWTTDRHSGWGNVLVPDGSVQTIRHIGFPGLAENWPATNRVVVP